MTGIQVPFSDYHFYGSFESENSFGYLEIHSPILSSPFKFESKYLNGPIVSKRSINLGGSEMSFSVKYQALYDSPSEELSNLVGSDNGIPFEQIFFLNSIVYLFIRNYDGTYFQLNAGVIRNVDETIDAKGEDERVIKCFGADRILERFQVNLDFGTLDQDQQVRSSENISGALTQISDVIKSQSSLKEAVKSIWDNLFYDFVQGVFFKKFVLFGGKKLLSKSTEISDPSHLILTVCDEAYSKDFIQEVMVAGNLSIGGSGISILELIRQFASPPLYELFVDSMSSASLTSDSFGSEATREGTPDLVGPKGFAPGTTNLSEVYSVEERTSKVVFRQTPYFYWDYLDETQEGGKYQVMRGPHYQIDFRKIQRVKVNQIVENIYSGVMVSPNISSLFGLVLSKPIYNTSLITLVGQNILTIKINGINMKGEVTGDRRNQFKEALDRIRNMIFYIFCNPKNLKHLTGSFLIAFTPIRIGVPFKIINRPEPGQQQAEESHAFINSKFNAFALEKSLGENGYIVSVTDTFDPSGSATSEVEFKWMDSAIDYTDILFSNSSS